MEVVNQATDTLTIGELDIKPVLKLEPALNELRNCGETNMEVVNQATDPLTIEEMDIKPVLKLEPALNIMNFAVVTFPEDDDSLGVIPTNWVNETGQTCLYPTVTSEFTKNKMIYSRQQPRSDWKEFEIRILKKYERYETAKAYLSGAEMTLNIESDIEPTTTRKRRRKEKKIVLPGEDSSTSEDEIDYKKKNPYISESSQPPCNRPKSATKCIPQLCEQILTTTRTVQTQTFSDSTTTLTQYTALTSSTENHSEQASPTPYFTERTPTPIPHQTLQTTATPSSKQTLNNKSPKINQPQKLKKFRIQKDLFSPHPTNSRSTASLPPIQSLQEHFEARSQEEPTILSSSSSSSGSSSSSVSEDIIVLKRNQEMMWEVLGEFSQKLDTILRTLARIENRFGQHELETNNKDPGSDFFSQLPLTKANFLEFEDKLQEPSFREKVVKILISTNGTSIKNFAANLMKKLLLDEVAEEYSLTGKHGQSAMKKPFIKTSLFFLILEIFIRKYEDGDEKKLREGVSDWLMQAKFRRLRREKRGASQTCPSETTISSDE